MAPVNVSGECLGGTVMKNGYRLLVVEDDAALCESIADLLRVSGYHVDTARDGEAALRLLREAPRPDAILLDVILPRMTADRLLHSMDDALWPRPPVVLMTGMVEVAGALPGGDVLVKPFDVDELLERLDHACRVARVPAVAAHAP
jgi:DNA-binding response OmpR family regulator